MASPARRGAAIAVIAASLIAPWEGLWLTAKVDRIGTGQPVTVCYGMTSADRPVHVGDHYTPEQCFKFLRADIPKYAEPILKCIHVPVSDHFAAAMTSAGYNAGARAVCKSPMVARINANPNDVTRACNALTEWYTRADGTKVHGWYTTARGRFIPGLLNRREAERKVCLTLDAGAAPPPKAKPPIVVQPTPVAKPPVVVPTPAPDNRSWLGRLWDRLWHGKG